MGENLMFPFYANTPNKAKFFCNLMQNYVVTFYGSLSPPTLQYYDVWYVSILLPYSKFVSCFIQDVNCLSSGVQHLMPMW